VILTAETLHFSLETQITKYYKYVGWLTLISCIST